MFGFITQQQLEDEKEKTTAVERQLVEEKEKTTAVEKQLEVEKVIGRLVVFFNELNFVRRH